MHNVHPEHETLMKRFSERFLGLIAFLVAVGQRVPVTYCCVFFVY